MAQIEDLRKQQANHEERISKLEALINPPAESQNFLDDATQETNPEGGMGIVVSDNGQQPSVSEEGNEEQKDEAN